MKYLLDTHILIWMIFSPEKLSEEVQIILADTENTIYVSVINFWEISLKFSLGNLALKNTTPEKLIDICKMMKLVSIPLSENNAATFYKISEFFHKDPFDRMLIWQSIENNLTFVSNDKNVKKYTAIGLKVIG